MVEKNKVLTTDHIRGSPEFAPRMVQRMIDGQTNVKYQQQQQAADEETQAPSADGSNSGRANKW